VNFINKYNINKAIQYGVYRVSNYLTRRILKINPEAEIALILLDGNYNFQFPLLRMTRPIPPIMSIIKGDDTVFHISCASIIAKESRDEMLRKSSERFPAYRLAQNAGYGTAQHRDAIAEFGLTRFHRRAYVKKIAIL
jgi:ribonuclease HII